MTLKPLQGIIKNAWCRPLRLSRVISPPLFALIVLFNAAPLAGLSQTASGTSQPLFHIGKSDSLNEVHYGVQPRRSVHGKSDGSDVW
jgi:hypothetical protein